MEIYLRALEIDDYKIISLWRRDADVMRYLSGNTFFVSSEREKKFIENKIFDDSKNIYLGICESISDELIGYTSINNIDLRNLKAEWGGTLIGNKKYWGRRYGYLSAKLMLNFLFNEYPINKCYAFCLKDHPATIKLFEQLGFSQDGVLRNEIYKNGQFQDLLLYSILREEINGNF